MNLDPRALVTFTALREGPPFRFISLSSRPVMTLMPDSLPAEASLRLATTSVIYSVLLSQLAPALRAAPTI